MLQPLLQEKSFGFGFFISRAYLTQIIRQVNMICTFETRIFNIRNLFLFQFETDKVLLFVLGRDILDVEDSRLLRQIETLRVPDIVTLDFPIIAHLTRTNNHFLPPVCLGVRDGFIIEVLVDGRSFSCNET